MPESRYDNGIFSQLAMSEREKNLQEKLKGKLLADLAVVETCRDVAIDDECDKEVIAQYDAEIAALRRQLIELETPPLL